jgi:hypothetical protein
MLVLLGAAFGYDLFMVNKSSGKTYPYDRPATYQISVLGRIGPAWSDRLEGMTIQPTTEEAGAPVTTLKGDLSDQAALAGVLNTLYELHLTLLMVKRLNDR